MDCRRDRLSICSVRNIDGIIVSQRWMINQAARLWKRMVAAAKLTEVTGTDWNTPIRVLYSSGQRLGHLKKGVQSQCVHQRSPPSSQILRMLIPVSLAQPVPKPNDPINIHDRDGLR